MSAWTTQVKFKVCSKCGSEIPEDEEHWGHEEGCPKDGQCDCDICYCPECCPDCHPGVDVK